METRQAFPERIADERKNAGLTQDELASQLGISRQSITLYEKGARVPDIEVLRKFADFFDVTADYLLGITDNRTSESEIIGDMLGLDDFQINFLHQKGLNYQNPFRSFAVLKTLVLFFFVPFLLPSVEHNAKMYILR